MEEKERYVIRYDLDYNRCLIDTEENQGVGDYIQIVKLLNQQSKRLKEFEQENQQLKDQVKKSYQEGLLQKQFDKDMEIQELKDKISFAIAELEKVKEYALELFKKFCQSAEYLSNKSLVGRRFIEYYPFNDYIDNQIKQLKEMK